MLASAFDSPVAVVFPSTHTKHLGVGVRKDDCSAANAGSSMKQSATHTFSPPLRLHGFASSRKKFQYFRANLFSEAFVSFQDIIIYWSKSTFT
jgi:hypothetical protein